MKIGIIGAMDVEIEFFKHYFFPFNTKLIGPWKFFYLKKKFYEIIFVQSSVGIVNAASCAQALIDYFSVNLVINTGVAGSLRDDIVRGDIVVATQAINSGMDVANLGYRLGQTPGEKKVGYRADKTLVNAFVAVAKCTNNRVFSGIITTSDTFVCQENDKRYLKKQFGALCCEMEGSAIAQVSEKNGILWLIIRSISDNALKNDTQNYIVFEKYAAKKSALMVTSFINNLLI